MGGVTNVHPHLTAGPVPAALTAAPPPAAAADAARLLPSVAFAPAGPAERSHPLPSPPIPLTQDESLGGVTNIHLPVTAGLVPAALTAAPPLAAAADAARLLPSVALAPGSPTERSQPLPSSPTPLTQEEGSGGVTNVHPPLTAGPVPAAPTAATPLTAVDDAARLLPSVALASVSPYESSYPLPQSPLPLSAPPSTGDGWRVPMPPPPELAGSSKVRGVRPSVVRGLHRLSVQMRAGILPLARVRRHPRPASRPLGLRSRPFPAAASPRCAGGPLPS